ncbi:conserved hypothetical protein [Methylorubrum populi BJ001]|uniref:Uncharacterized protein n=1 Tax=Methylorubrum populi (strain ATCC BAA-705 / NCIMB 13946 / BJ001) TaxID=441620 RepID=B1Z8U1_METPB|nr:hypothetical protein [Methylorubrum populi]ACB83243.1 conserved hypothetical protein [Methylorubrum populi BJ001]OAH38212.1 hypothetical protein AX289_12195 [Methylorubrum populi]PZP68195.1 MAG: hypothetical protein DI590_17790 [Methylorubrum populi]
MSNNNDNGGAIMVFAVFITMATFMVALVFAILTFLSIAATGICLSAWNKPVRFFGHTITPQQAREFVARGVLGAILVPCFALFASGLFGFRINPDYWLFLPLGGYAFGSLVIGYEIEKARAEAAQQAAAMQALLPPEQPARPVRTIEAKPFITPVSDEESQPQPQPEPFRFATWDDEEELRK